MTTLKTLEMARKHLATGNGHGYAGIVSGMIRSGYPAKIKAARAAIAADKAERFFVGLATALPTAA